MPYAELDNARLWYEDSGGDGPVIVLLHGAAGASEIWREQVELFTARGYRCLCPDLRGFGRSHYEGDASAAGTVAGDVAALARLLALPPFFLVAHAYGGFGGLEFGIDYPQNLRALVVSTSFGGLTDPEYTALRARHVAPDLGQRPLEERELGASYRAADPAGVRRFLELNARASAPSVRQALGRPLTLQRLDGMAVRTLLIAGDEDAYAPPPVMRAMADHIPGCEFAVIEKAGHCAYWEQPQEWNRIVAGFLGRAS